MDTLRRTCLQINAERGNAGIANGSAHALPPPTAAAFPKTLDCSAPSTVAALARICLGELLETYAALQAERICKTTEIPYSAQQQAEMARLCADAYGVAIWTSAHAEYLSMASLVSSSNDDVIIQPELSLVLCISNAPDQTALLERACHPRACGSADAQAMLALLMRATNAGSRGWESTLLSGVRNSEGIARTWARGGRRLYGDASVSARGASLVVKTPGHPARLSRSAFGGGRARNRNSLSRHTQRNGQTLSFCAFG